VLCCVQWPKRDSSDTQGGYMMPINEDVKRYVHACMLSYHGPWCQISGYICRLTYWNASEHPERGSGKWLKSDQLPGRVTYRALAFFWDQLLGWLPCSALSLYHHLPFFLLLIFNASQVNELEATRWDPSLFRVSAFQSFITWLSLCVATTAKPSLV